MILFLVLALLGRIFYLIFYKRGKMIKNSKNNKIKTMIILGSGGHTTEMLKIINNLNFKIYTPRIYVHAQSDEISFKKIIDIDDDKNNCKILKISRSREVGQSYLTSILTTIIALFESVLFLWNEKPDLILCNGPGTCVPICICSFLYRILFLCKTKLIFIESFCRVKSFSLSGKILYYFADNIIVLWPDLCNNNSKHVHFVN